MTGACASAVPGVRQQARRRRTADTTMELSPMPKNVGLRRNALGAVAAVLTAGILLSAGPAAAQGHAATSGRPDVVLPPLNPTALRQTISGLPNAAVTSAVVAVTGSRGHWSGAAGTADLRAHLAATPRARFRIGSVTKVFTATIVLQLVAEHRVDLNQPVQRYLPGVLPASYPPISIAQLLNHTSGLPSAGGVGDGEGDAAQFIARRFDAPTPRQIVAGLGGQPLAFAPGSAQRYNGINYYLLGMLIEARTGHSYVDELTDRILLPLHLSDTSLPAATSYHIPGTHLHGYLDLTTRGGSRLVDVTEQSPYPWAEGGMISSTYDLSRFMTALFAGRLLPAGQTQDLFTVPDVPYLGTSQCQLGPAGRACFGMGLESVTVHNLTLWGKTGSRPGYTDGVFATRDRQRMLAYGFTPTDENASNMSFILHIASAAFGLAA
jgi:D-alanyl-D-alanine carboxypeptidase